MKKKKIGVFDVFPIVKQKRKEKKNLRGERKKIYIFNLVSDNFLAA